MEQRPPSQRTQSHIHICARRLDQPIQPHQLQRLPLRQQPRSHLHLHKGLQHPKPDPSISSQLGPHQHRPAGHRKLHQIQHHHPHALPLHLSLLLRNHGRRPRHQQWSHPLSPGGSNAHLGSLNLPDPCQHSGLLQAQTGRHAAQHSWAGRSLQEQRQLHDSAFWQLQRKLLLFSSNSSLQLAVLRGVIGPGFHFSGFGRPPVCQRGADSSNNKDIIDLLPDVHTLQDHGSVLIQLQHRAGQHQVPLQSGSALPLGQPHRQHGVSRRLQ